MEGYYAEPDGGECKVSSLIHPPRPSPRSPLSPGPNCAAPAATSARAGGRQNLAAVRFVVGGQPIAVSSVDPRTVGPNKWSVWRLQGLLGRLMSTSVAAGADIVTPALGLKHTRIHEVLFNSLRTKFCTVSRTQVRGSKGVVEISCAASIWSGSPGSICCSEKYPSWAMQFRIA